MSIPLKIDAGSLRGALHPDYAGLEGWLGEIRASVAHPAAVLTDGRNRVVRIDPDPARGRPGLVVKRFPRPGWPKAIADRRTGSKAFRSWRTALYLRRHGIGTPAPVAWVDAWERSALRESYYVTVHEPGLTDLKRELIRLYREDPLCAKVMRLLEVVARGVRGLHDAGVWHRDLGNQNIVFPGGGAGGGSEAMFIDLNRARIKPALTLAERAGDISRLFLPSDLLRVHNEMYFGARPPEEFQYWEQRYRARYQRHSRTRKYRHPIRRRRAPPPTDPAQIYPDARDIWIWDDRSVQPINVLRRKDRNRLHSRGDTLRQAASTARALPPVLRRYRELLDAAFLRPVELTGRIGVAVEPPPGGEDQEQRWFSGLGPVPALVRFYHHQGPAAAETGVAWVQRLAAAGTPVAIALVQDRRAVKDPMSWRRFAGEILDRVHRHVDWVEIGHAVNRVKWGIWRLAEHRELVAPVADWRERFPGLRFMGPAGIDFEYPHVLATLARLPDGCRFDALSHHLYVDRRGAPENHQGGFSLLEKCALGRAIAGWSRRCDDRLIISETNWPLTGAGVWSPVVAPFDTPGDRPNDPSVSEHEYAAYLIRYLLIALCSGLVERVYWWRLAGRGFGLIDDTNPAAWRARPAYRVLAVFLDQVGRATFIARRLVGLGTWFYLFRRPDESRVVLGYSTVAGDTLRIPFRYAASLDAQGQDCAAPSALPGLPVYFQAPEGFALAETGP